MQKLDQNKEIRVS